MLQQRWQRVLFLIILSWLDALVKQIEAKDLQK
jgi:hypothetical protein